MARDARGRFLPKGVPGALPGGRLPSVTPSGGPFVGVKLPSHAGDRLAARLNELEKLDGVTVSAGLQGRGGSQAGPEEATDNELVIIGRAHEYGIDQHERPWLRTSIAVHGKTWVGGMKTAVQEIAKGDIAGGRQTIRQVGVVMVGDIQQTVATGPWVPNSPATIAAKGSSKPLIDTAQMVQSVRAALEGPDMPAELIG